MTTRHTPELCGHVLWDALEMPTRVCMEPRGTEHDHDNAASREIAPNEAEQALATYRANPDAVISVRAD